MFDHCLRLLPVVLNCIEPRPKARAKPSAHASTSAVPAAAAKEEVEEEEASNAPVGASAIVLLLPPSPCDRCAKSVKDISQSMTQSVIYAWVDRCRTTLLWRGAFRRSSTIAHAAAAGGAHARRCRGRPVPRAPVPRACSRMPTGLV